MPRMQGPYLSLPQPSLRIGFTAKPTQAEPLLLHGGTHMQQAELDKKYIPLPIRSQSAMEQIRPAEFRLKFQQGMINPSPDKKESAIARRR